MNNRQLLASVLVAFVLVAGIGAAISLTGSPQAPGSGGAFSVSPSRSKPNGEMLSRLKDYARSFEAEEPRSAPAAGELLPDVNTMIQRLEARLKTTPQDTKGWRMLGWAYFHTEFYEQAATAYARAVELDPDSADLKLLYEEAKAKSHRRRASKSDKFEAVPPREHDAAIQSMVDRLADRLESSPRDVEGWTRLMRSRVVLGEREVAATAFRKALEVFKDDSAASGKIEAAAMELGLKTE